MFRYAGELKVSAEEMFNEIINTAIIEVENKIGKKITREDLLEGYKYKTKRRVGNDIVDATVVLKKPEVNRRFTTTYSFNDQHYEMNYIITPLDDYKIKLEYTQEDGKRMGGISQWFAERKMRNGFKQMEKYIIEKRRKTEGK